MLAWQPFGDKTDIVSDLPVTVIHSHAAPSTPPAIRQHVVERLEAGERIEPRAVNEMIWTAKQEAKKVAEEAKLTAEERQSRKEKAARELRNEQRRQKRWDLEDKKHQEEDTRLLADATEVASILASTIDERLDEALRIVSANKYKYKFGGHLVEALYQALSDESGNRHRGG